MDFISNYNSLPLNQFNQIVASQRQSSQFPLSVTSYQIKKIKRLLQGRLSDQLITFNEISQNPENQFQYEEIQKYMNLLDMHEALNFSMIDKTKIRGYDIFVNFYINIQRASYCFQTTLMRNYKLVKVQSKNLMKFMTRYFTSQNAKIQFGSFFVHPLVKKITFSIHSHSTLDRINLLLRNPQKFLNFFQQQKNRISVLWDANIQQILYLINKKPYQQQKAIQPTYTDKKMAYIKQKLKKISTMIIHSHIDAHFFVQNKGIPRFKNIEDHQRNWKVQQIKAQITAMQNKSRPLVSLYNCIQHLIGQKKLLSSTFKYPQWQLPQMRQMSQNLACLEYGGRYQIYSQIQIMTVEKQVCIFESGFSQIYMIDGIMKRQGEPGPTRSRIIKKVTQQKRYRNEIQVLKLLHNQKCLFFPRYFFCQQQEHKQSILLQYIPQSSIDRYLMTKSTFIGNQTKLFFLFEIIVALRFLRDNSIVHIDLKPQNVLIKIVGDGKQNIHYLIKLIDFGQSYSSRVQQLSNKSSSRGFTIPYAPPQLLSKGKRFDQKTDVYSFGVIMYEIMFDHFPIQIMKLDKQNFIDEDYLKFYSIPFEKLSNYGTQDVMILLYYICLKCLQPQPNDRPTLDWLNIILKDLILIYEELAK